MTKSNAPSFDPAAHLVKQGWKGKGTGGSGPGQSSYLISFLAFGVRFLYMCWLTLVKL
jgi:hypothetical protein